MNKKKIFSTSLIILGIALFWAGPVFANGLVVEFEETPLFDEANFLPGESITRWVKVINNTNQTQRIASEAINVLDPDSLGDALTLEIREGESRIYSGTLSQFFNAGEVYLSDLAGNGNQTQYDFIVSFYSGANNNFQGKTLSFDILIGFQGIEGGVAPGGGSGGGGYLPPGLTIQDESTVEVGETSVTITWLTSYSSTSQVIYGAEGQVHTLDLTDNTGTPPKYGYAQTTPEYDVSPKVTFHSVTISGLTPGTTYYYRCVSHASLAVSQEHSFTTLDVLGEQKESVYAPPEGGATADREELGPGEEAIGEQEEEEPAQISEEIEAGKEETMSWLKRPEFVEIEEEEIEEKEKPGLGWLLAAIGNLFKLKNLWWLLLLLLIIIFFLVLLSRRKRKNEELKK